MATSDNGDGAVYEPAKFYSHDQIVEEQKNNRDMMAAIVAQLPPFPFYLQVLGSSDETVRRGILEILETSSKDARRPLSQDEARQLANLNMDAIKTLNLQSPLSTITALYFERRGRKSGRFPFGLLSKINKERFGFRSFSISGRPVAIAWNLARFGAYLLAAKILWTPIIGVCATVKFSNAISKDPVMKPFLADIARTREELRKAQVAQRAQQVQAAQQRLGRATPPPPPPPQTPSPVASWPAPPEQAAPYQEPYREQERRPDDGLSLFDEQPDEPTGPQPSSSSSRSGGSAWDRLRKGTTAAKGPGSADSDQAPMQGWAERRRRAQQAGTDSYAYSENDDDQAAARDKAQRDFDAMLERERRSGSGS